MLLELVKNNAKILTGAVFSIPSTPNDNIDQMFTKVPIEFNIERLTQFKIGQLH